MNKPLFLVFLLILGIGGYFWSQSRYPALDEKAMMEGEVSTSGIGFDRVVEVKPTDAWWKQTIGHTLNWYHTNWKGMTFGILFAAALMLLFTLIKDWQSDNRFVNAFFGLMFGAPLGVCVNCAAPIAQGASRSGAKVETSLAMMLSSPTLNVVVLTMLFSLFPFYIAALKLGLTVGFILIGVPVISYLFGEKAKSERDLYELEDKLTRSSMLSLQLSDISPRATSWKDAFLWVFRSYPKSLWYIIRTTVPLMLLAGFLGSIMITVLPWNALSEILPNSNFVLIIASMFVLASVGVFFPVPMSFDVIIVSTLMAGGLPVRYSMVLLFTLGIFSVYSFLITRQAISSKVAISTALGILLVGVCSGFVAQKFESRYFNFFEEKIASFSSLQESRPTVISSVEFAPYSNGILPDDSAFKSLDTIRFLTQHEVSVDKVKLNAPLGDNDLLFTSKEGWEVGIDPPYEFSAMKVIQPYSDGRSISTGDVNKDGLVDVLLSGDSGVNLYLNKANGRFFEEYRLNLPLLDTNWICNAVLVDMDNDDFLDIVITTYWNGNYIVFSSEGEFSNQRILRLPNENEAPLSVGLSFGDVNKDGLLDVALGNFSLGVNSVRTVTYRSSRDALLINGQTGWIHKTLDDMSGETLSALITDFNMDGNPDLAFGIDFNIPDMYYLGNGTDEVSVVMTKDSLIDGRLKRTMSVACDDIDNDLVPEIFLTQISEMGFDVNLKVRNEEEAFSKLKRKEERERLEQIFRMKNQLAQAAIRADISLCDESVMNDGVALAILKRDQFLPERRVDAYPKGWEQLAKMYYHLPLKEDAVVTKDRVGRYLKSPELSKENSLLKLNQQGQFVNVANEYGLGSTSWTWNGKFADLNNDEFKDLYAVNGTFYRSHNRLETNVLLINSGGTGFNENTSRSGVTNYLPANSYAYLDVDNDGDLDILSVPAIGPVFLYTNNTVSNNSIQFELRDRKGNIEGIGSKIYVYYGKNNERHQMKEVQLGGGFRSFEKPMVHFGLGEFEAITKVEIIWSTGGRTVVEQEFPAGNRYIISREAELDVEVADKGN